MNETSGRPHPEWALPRVFAHRCGGALAPENTLAGLRITKAAGFGAVEFDVMLSADGTPWLIHDEALERTTTGAGLVCQTTDSVLRSLDAGVRHHRAFAGEALPSFATTAGLCRELGLHANVEIKPATGFEAVTGEVVMRKILELWQGAPLPLVSSFSEAALVAARQISPDVPLGYLCVSPDDDWVQRMDAVNAFSLHCNGEKLDDAVLETAHAHGIPVLCWTVNSRPAAERLIERGVTSVFSDRIDVMGGL